MPQKPKNDSRNSTKLDLHTNDSGEPAEISWIHVDPRILSAMVALVTDVGGALILGKTRDGGALALTLLHDDLDKVYKEYDNDVSDGVPSNALKTLDAFAEAMGRPTVRQRLGAEWPKRG